MNLRLVSAALPLFAAVSALADDDYDDKDFSLRFPAALSRFSRFPDVAAIGGSSAASEWGSSSNPAGVAWLAPRGISLQTARLGFDEGTRIGVEAATFSLPTVGWGTFQFSTARGASNDATTRDGLDFGYDAWFGEAQWARRASEKTTYGFNVSFTKAHVDQGFGGTTFVRSGSSQWGFRSGVLHQLTDSLRLGFAADYGTSSDDTEGFDPVRVAPISERDTTSQVLFRPGIAWEYDKNRKLYADYQFATFGNDSGRLSEHRLFAGADHEILPLLNVRAGGAIDSRGNTTLSAGFGLYPSERVVIEFGWQRNAFPEIEREFGRSSSFALSVSILF